MFLSSCSTVNTKLGGLLNLDTDLDLKFSADKNINPDDNNSPSPLYIRMYELKSDKKFKRAGFIDLYERDKQVLGDDMIAKQRLKRIIPGERRNKDYVLDPQTHYVGLFAEFQKYKSATFKVVIPVDPTNVIASSSAVHISGNTVSATNSD
jgi:type VI secretion system protein VasD